jgi:Ca2+-binding EF-hand superfamily protein
MQAAKRGFAAFDLNHNGVISRREWSVSEARATAPIPERNRAEFKCALDETFKLMDSNHDGKITFAEFIADSFGKHRQPVRGCY